MVVRRSPITALSDRSRSELASLCARNEPQRRDELTSYPGVNGLLTPINVGWHLAASPRRDSLARALACASAIANRGVGTAPTFPQ